MQLETNYYVAARPTKSHCTARHRQAKITEFLTWGMHVLRQPKKTHFQTKCKQEKITEFFPWRLSDAAIPVTAAPATGPQNGKTRKRARKTEEWGLKGFYKIVDDGTAPITLVVTSTHPNGNLRARESVRAAIRVAKVRCVVLPDTLARIHEYTFKRCCELLSIASRVHYCILPITLSLVAKTLHRLYFPTH